MSVNVYNPVLRLVQGTQETVPITVTDTLGLITDLSASSPNYEVSAVDPVTGANAGIVVSASATAVGMLVKVPIDTSTNGGFNNISAFKLAGSAATVPLTVVANSNDQFYYNTVLFTVAPGVYSTIGELVDAVNAATDQFLNPFTAYARASVSGSHIRITGIDYGAVDNGYLLNIGISDILVSLGFTDGDTLAGGTAGGQWQVGQYNLYISFGAGGDDPILGPFPFFVIPN